MPESGASPVSSGGKPLQRLRGRFRRWERGVGGATWIRRPAQTVSQCPITGIMLNNRKGSTAEAPQSAQPTSQPLFPLRRLAPATTGTVVLHLVLPQILVVQSFQPFAKVVASDSVRQVGGQLGSLQHAVIDEDGTIHSQRQGQ